MSGTLYLCATPIGNLEDITLRVLRILKEVDLIAAEDTRTSGHLLRHFDIHTPTTSYHKFNEHEKGRELVDKLLAGTNIALITDAGTPAISPGANACITALTLSGRSTRRFSFEGFLPADKKDRDEILRQIKTERRTIVLYEAPHRLVKTLKLLAETLGETRGITLCRELTKKFETITVTTIGEAIAQADNTEPRGEYVLVLDGKPDEEIEAERRAEFETMSIADHVASFEAQGMTRKEAMKAVAVARGMSRRDVYQELLSE